jgi:hypothetical protein
MGFGGGGKGTQAPVAPPVQRPAMPSYKDTSKAEEAKQKAEQAIMLMKGRQSTILTSGQDLGNVDVNKRQLLGA